ncbi:MAG: hypothetical protein ACRDIY_00025 [Chloroflexota bacterium]
MIYWAPLLHFYQPPTQLPGVLDRICDECYRPVIEIFEGLTAAQVTINVTGSLIELLREHRATDVVDGLRRLGERGTVELTGTAMYHPILPLIPAREGRRQVVLNQRISRSAFGNAYHPLGFFSPELCFAPSIVPTVLETGHRWLLASGVACPTEWPLEFIPSVGSDEGDLAILFRDDILSNRIAFADLDVEGFFASLRALRGWRQSIYVVTALDAETFGHHLPGWDQRFLARVIQALAGDGKGTDNRDAPDGIQMVTISRLLELFPRRHIPMPHPSSWSTTGDDLAAGNPYPLWKDPGNHVHQLQWELTELVLDLAQRAEALSDTDVSREHARIARTLMDRALHSCQYWWASRRPMWEINMINRGLLAQQEAMLNATRAIRSSHAPDYTRSDATYRYLAAREVATRILDELVA